MSFTNYDKMQFRNVPLQYTSPACCCCCCCCYSCW